MTRRHDALMPLTHDHHHALAQARALIAGSRADEDERKRVDASFVEFYGRDTLLHFHEEEEVLFPRLLEQVEEAPSELIEVLIDHVRIHGMTARLRDALAEGAPAGEDLTRLGETLRAHVRLEENHLFPLIEAEVPEPELSAIEFAQRRRLESPPPAH